MSSGRLVHGALDRPVVEEPLDAARGDELGVEALLGTDVGVLQVDEVQLGVVPVEAVAVAVLREQLELGHPVQLAGAQHRVLLEPGQHRLPAGEDVARLVVDVVAEPVVDELAGQVEVLQLQLHRGEGAPVTQREEVLERRVVGDRAQRRDRLVHAEVAGDVAVLDHGEHERRGADLEVGRHLREVGVTEDHVQPAVLLRVGVRLVAGVDDRPLEGGLEARPRPRSSRRAG